MIKFDRTYAEEHLLHPRISPRERVALQHLLAGTALASDRRSIVHIAERNEDSNPALAAALQRLLA